jgi:hypothetical protein
MKPRQPGSKQAGCARVPIPAERFWKMREDAKPSIPFTPVQYITR